jgi:hypothetical protein
LNKKTIRGVGYLGSRSGVYRTAPEYRLLYICWFNILSRCYVDSNKDFVSYGGKGIKVADEWLCFSTFFEDVHLIEGWDLSLYLTGYLELDKDIICEASNIPKIYSRDTCQWVSREINVAASKATTQIKQKEFIATSPEGIRFTANNQVQFAKEHGLSRSKVGECLAGKYPHHKKWKFTYL